MDYGDVQRMLDLDMAQRLIEAKRRGAKGKTKPMPMSYADQIKARYGASPLDLYVSSQVRGKVTDYGRAEAIRNIERDLSMNDVDPWEAAISMPKMGIQAMMHPDSSLKQRVMGGAMTALSPLMIGAAGIDKLTGQTGGANMAPLLSPTPTPGEAAMYVTGGGGSALQQAARLGKNKLIWDVATLPTIPASDYLAEHGHGDAALALGLVAPLATVHGAGKLNPKTLIDSDFSKGLLAPLANQTGAFSISPSALSDAWQNTVGSKLMDMGDKIGSVPLMGRQSRLSKWLGGNTLNEWLHAPTERMDQNAAQIFRDVRSEAERSSEALRRSAKQMGELNLEEREALRNVLRSNMDITKGGAHQAKISKILDPLAEANTLTHSKLYTDANKAKLVEDELDTHLLRVFAEDPHNPLWSIKKQAAAGHDLTTATGTLKWLDSVLRDPLAPTEVKNIARDLYDLPAKTAIDVSQAHRKSYEALLYSELKNNPNWVVPASQFMQQIANAHPGGIPNKQVLKQIEKQLKEFVPIPKNAEWDGLLVHKDIAEGLRDLDTHVTNFRSGWNKYFLNPWKFMKIGLNVPARFRDVVSNMMFNDIYGAAPLSPLNISVYGGAMNDLRKAAKGAKIPELESFFYRTGGKLDALNSVATDPIFSAMRHDANPIDTALGALYGNKVGQFMSNTMKNIDLWTKYAKFKHNLISGKFTEEEAIVDALRATGNMLEQPRAIRNVRDTAMPFFGWTAHSLKTIANGMANHPVRTLKWFAAPVLAAQQSLDSLDMSKEEYLDFQNTLPEYLKHEVMGIPTKIPLPYRDEKGRIQMMDIGWWIPGLQDLSELDQTVQNPVRFMQNPAFTLGAALLNNKKFSGAPIYFDWDTPGTKWAKGLGYTLQQLLPPMTPGVGTQASKMWEAFKGEDPDALTPEQAMATQIGARITPIDENAQYHKNKARLDAWESEARYQRKKELGKIQDPTEQENVDNYYNLILQNLQQERNGGRE